VLPVSLQLVQLVSLLQVLPVSLLLAQLFSLLQVLSVSVLALQASVRSDSVCLVLQVDHKRILDEVHRFPDHMNVSGHYVFDPNDLDQVCFHSDVPVPDGFLPDDCSVV
jgi:hypothetical protein